MEQKVVVAGWGQITQTKELNQTAKKPMELMIQASKRASEMMASKTALSTLDGIMIVRTLSHHYASPAKLLAQKVGAAPKFTHVSGIGGNSP
jgi:acetyl-CoA C-acetyltransferase